MGRRRLLALAWLAPALLSACASGPRVLGKSDEPAWAESVRRIHARFRGRPGTLAHFGDSITVTQAYWAPLLERRQNASPELEAAFQRVRAHLRAECWREWKGPEFGSEGSRTIAWARENIDRWLERLNPEAAVLLFGTNDLHQSEAAEYERDLRAVVRRCLSRGTVVLLTTPPPRHGFEAKAKVFAQVVRRVAQDLRLPLIDFHGEVLRRRPTDWDGALPRFASYEGYDIPTLISRDGVHPSYPTAYQGDYSEAALSRSGYTLRSVLTLQAYDQVLTVLKARPKPRTGNPSP